MRRPTLPLIATSAVLGTMAIAVPALAASGSTPTAHTARARRCSTVIVISHGRRVRACLVQGPRGFTGFPGAKGTTGKTGATGKTGPAGKNGTNGTNGAAGAPGTARAYAVIQPTSPSTANLITPSNITAVSEVNSGIYCITPAAPINPAVETVAVSPEVSYSPGGALGVIAVNAQHTSCPATAFEVDTYAQGSTTASDGFAFTIVIP